MNDSIQRDIRKMIVRGWKNTREYIASERLRRMRALLFQVYVLIALLAFAALALLANTVPVFRPDVLITQDLQNEVPHWFGLVLEAVSVPGYGPESVAIIVVLTAYLAIIGLRWESISVLFAGVTSGLLNFLVKAVVARPRPSADVVNVFIHLKDYSFPSGHVMFYTAFFGFLIFLAYTLLKRSLPRFLLITLMMLLIALVGISRMYLGEHWASDVLGGYLGGSLSLILSILFYRWGKQERVVQQPIAVTGHEEKPVPSEEKQEIQQTLNNPLLPKKEAAKEEQKVHDKPNEDHPARH